MFKSIFFAVLVITYSLAFAPSIFGFTVYNDIFYYDFGTGPDPERNQLDVYVPDGVTFGTPVMFFVHGGTWMYNDRSDFAPVGEEMADQEGFVTVIPSFRLSDSLHPEVHHPDHITDVAQAFKWTVEYIAEYGGSPDRIVLCGHSSGGHLAALLATNLTYLEGAGASVFDIKCAVVFSMGIYDIPGLYRDLEPYSSMLWPYTPFPQIFTDDTLNWYDASPKYHLHDSMPPSIFFVAQEDMEHIIGGTYYGLVTLDGEIDDVYNDFNEYQPTDTFWIPGDHDYSFSYFVFDPESRARTLAIGFINRVFTGIEENTLKPASFEISCYPNPFNSAITIEIAHAEAFLETPVQLQIYNINGKLVHSDRQGYLSLQGTDACIYKWQPGQSVPSGIYLVKVTTSNRSVSRRILYLK
ncbi:alpha/beta fold hydrolase [bacterium]|nr:alpha/beta fold hydrolase [bacterium]